MSSIERALRVDFEDGGRSRRCQIHLPPGYPNRNNLVKLIREYGGDMQSHLAYADVVIVQDQLQKVEGMQKRIAATNKCRATIVVEPWLHDCIDRVAFISPQLERYSPSCLDFDRSESPLARGTTNTNLRRLRNDYTSKDEEAIMQVLSVWKGTILQAAELLSKMQDHTKQSFQTHLQANLDQGKFYNRRVEAYKRRQGLDGLQRVRDRLLEFDPNVAELLDFGVNTEVQADEDMEEAPAASQENQRRHSQLVDRSVQTATRNDTPPEPDMATPSKTLVARSQVSNVTHTRIETTVMTPNLNKQTVSTVAITNSATPPVRAFPQDQREAFIKELTMYLKSLYKDLPASQDGSVIGYLESSQDVPEPPRELFEHMSKMIPNHTTEEWRVHFSKPINRDNYLDLAREGLERMLVLERVALPHDATKDPSATQIEEESYDQLFDETQSVRQHSSERSSTRIVVHAGPERNDSARIEIKKEYVVEDIVGEPEPSSIKEVPVPHPSRAGRLFFSSSQMDSEEEVDEMQDTQETELDRGKNAPESQKTTSEEEIEDVEDDLQSEIEEDEIEDSSESFAEEPAAGLNGVTSIRDRSPDDGPPPNAADVYSPSYNRTNDDFEESEYRYDDHEEYMAKDQQKVIREKEDSNRSKSRSAESSDQSVLLADRTIIYMPSISESSASSESSVASSSRSRSRSSAATIVPPPSAAPRQTRSATRLLTKGPRTSYTTLAQRMIPYVEIDNGNLQSPYNSIRVAKSDIRPLVINGYKRRRLSSSSVEEDCGINSKTKIEISEGWQAHNRSTSGTKIHQRLHEIVTAALGPSSESRRALKRLRIGSRSDKDRLEILAEQYHVDRGVVEGYFKAVKQDYDLLESILKVPR